MIASVVTLAQRPDLVDAMWSMPNTWPAFMREDPVAGVYFERLPDVFDEHQLLALDERGEIVGKVHSVPFAWSGSYDDLPDRGWDGVLERAFLGRDRGEVATAVSLLEARIVPACRGKGLSYEMLDAARRNVRRLGFGDLFAPVRPTAKAREPRTPMAEYVARVDDDGLPADPWLRVHARLGAAVVKLCPLSMVVPGSLAQWRDWTGLALTSSGMHEVPGALVAVHVSCEHDHAVYVEPNVWMHHRLSAT